MIIRLLKASMVLSVALWATLIAAGNLFDYQSNWLFVQHVLAMDTVFPGNALKWRAITSPVVQTASYWTIIATEALIALLCLAGGLQLLNARHNRRAFVAAKPVACCGLVLAFLLYYVGFVVAGGEWFCMWQSAIWNGQAKAVMFLTCSTLVLVVLLLREEDEQQCSLTGQRT